MPHTKLLAFIFNVIMFIQIMVTTICIHGMNVTVKVNITIILLKVVVVVASFL